LIVREFDRNYDLILRQKASAFEKSSAESNQIYYSVAITDRLLKLLYLLLGQHYLNAESRFWDSSDRIPDICYANIGQYLLLVEYQPFSEIQNN
jgi:hypothetical protein